MQQVAQYLGGERDYTLIKGGTGPLVYPAAHVYIYTALYYITDQGREIARAQVLFAALYIGVLGVVMACYRMAQVCLNLIASVLVEREGGRWSVVGWESRPLSRVLGKILAYFWMVRGL